jgi:hypothetical protein
MICRKFANGSILLPLYHLLPLSLARMVSEKWQLPQMILATSATAMSALFALTGPLYSFFNAGAKMPSFIAGCFAGKQRTQERERRRRRETG